MQPSETFRTEYHITIAVINQFGVLSVQIEVIFNKTLFVSSSFIKLKLKRGVLLYTYKQSSLKLMTVSGYWYIKIFIALKRSGGCVMMLEGNVVEDLSHL